MQSVDGVTGSSLSCNASSDGNDFPSNSKLLICNDSHSVEPKGQKLSSPIEKIHLHMCTGVSKDIDTRDSKLRSRDVMKRSSPRKSFDSEDIFMRCEDLKPINAQLSTQRDFAALSKDICLKKDQQTTVQKVSKTSCDNKPIQSLRMDEHLSLKISIPKCMITLKNASGKCESDVKKEGLKLNTANADSQQPQGLKPHLPREMIQLGLAKKSAVWNESEDVNEDLSKVNDKMAEWPADNNMKVDCSARNEMHGIVLNEVGFKREPLQYSPLKITLIKFGCNNWAVKQIGEVEGKRPYKSVRIGTLSTSDEGAAKRKDVLNRVKQALIKDKPIKITQSKPKCTNRFRSLKRKAVTLYAMKSRIIGRR